MSAVQYWAVVPAAGVGRRMASRTPKQYLSLGNNTVIEHALRPLLEHPAIARVMVALSPGDQYWPGLAVAGHHKLALVDGGSERCDSVLQGLRGLQGVAKADDWVLVHDAARPCLRTDDLALLIHTLKEDAVGGILATPVHDTVKLSGEGLHISKTVDRSRLWRAYTPQMFRFGVLFDALNRALEQGVQVTDEASAVEADGFSPVLVEGHSDNIKVTCPEDLALAAFYLRQMSGEEVS